MGKFLYFGGRLSVQSNTNANDLWTLDVSDGRVTWVQLQASGGAGPTMRGAACTAWDSDNNQMLLYGGQGGANLADTWSYSPGVGWGSRTVTGSTPGARSFAACAWDPSLHQMVLYGGQTSGPIGGLFSFDPISNVWTSYSPTPNPGNLSDSAVAFSPALGRTIFFGGRTASTSYSNLTWLLTFGIDGGAGQDAGSDAGTGADAGSDAGSGSDAGADGGTGSDAGSSDGGAASDAGASDGGSLDGGSGSDGGASTDAGSGPDAGSADPTLRQPLSLKVGCGCNHAPGAAEWLLVGFALVALGRTRLRRPR